MKSSIHALTVSSLTAALEAEGFLEQETNTCGIHYHKDNVAVCMFPDEGAYGDLLIDVHVDYEDSQSGESKRAISIEAVLEDWTIASVMSLVRAMHSERNS